MINFIKKILSNILCFLTPTRSIVIVIVTAFFWFLAFGDQGVYQLKRLLDMKYALISEREELNDSIDLLQKEKNLLSDPKNLEPVIRKELGYIKPGEILFELKQKTDEKNSLVSDINSKFKSKTP